MIFVQGWCFWLLLMHWKVSGPHHVTVTPIPKCGLSVTTAVKSGLTKNGPTERPDIPLTEVLRNSWRAVFLKCHIYYSFLLQILHWYYTFNILNPWKLQILINTVKQDLGTFSQIPPPYFLHCQFSIKAPRKKTWKAMPYRCFLYTKNFGRDF